MTRRAAFTLLEVLVVVAILVILAGVGVVSYNRIMEDARKGTAQTDCQGISESIDLYIKSPSNSTGAEPSSLQDLISPPFGGQSFLKDSQKGLRDPWGKEYQIQRKDMADGSTIWLVYTTAPDGTPISQYGIGQASRL
jgi:general secretion pathway protein G